MLSGTAQLILGQVDAAQAAKTAFQQFFVAGGSIVWFILLPMSIFTVYMAIDLMITIRRSRLLPAGLGSEIAACVLQHGINALPARLSGRPDLLSRSILRAVDRSRQLGGSAESIRQYTAEALQEEGLGLMRKVQWCQILGSIAPMVGLFGTVYGMIVAFNLLGQGSEGPRFELLADSISVALVTTYWGLLVAIPALSLYGVFHTRTEVFVSEAALEIEAILGRILDNGQIQRVQADLHKQSKSLFESPTSAEPKRVRPAPLPQRPAPFKTTITPVAPSAEQPK